MNTVQKRTWTDEQLGQAIAASTSWRGVLRELGLVGTSATAIRIARRHAIRLDLDVSHIRGGRRWSDDQLRVAVCESSAWEEVLTKLDQSSNGGAALHVKANAIRLGLNTSHLDRPRDRVRQPAQVRPVISDRDADLRYLRVAAPAAAAAWFALRGCAVSFPTEPAVYDLLVDASGGISRVQVKTTTFATKDGWTVGVGRHPDTHAKKAGHRVAYDPDVIDLFFIIDGDLTMYLIPSRAIAGRVQVLLRTYRKYVIGNAGGFLGARADARLAAVEPESLTRLRWRLIVVGSERECGAWLILGRGWGRSVRSSGCRCRRCCRSRCRTRCWR
jgi:hypothetical protein